MLIYLTDRNRHLEWLADDINIALADARHWLGETFSQLGDIQQQVIAEMAFQLGWHGLTEFKQMRAALVAHNVGLAADEGLRSMWASQTPQRAKELMDLLRG
jgi:lysozyme